MNPPIILDAAAVARHLPQLDVLGELRALFKALGEGQAAQPPQTLTAFPGGAGDFITYMGAIRAAGVFGAKLSPYIVTDAAPIITAWTQLMSMSTGAPLALIDAMQLTTERTAGTTALAVDLLAPGNARELAIIGSGAIARAHLRHVLGLRDWARVRVYSPNLSGNAGTQAAWRALHPGVEFAPEADACITGADVVLLCTSSGTPVIDTGALNPTALVTSISTNAPDAHEVAPVFLTEADIYVDFAATTPATATEIRRAVQHLGLSPSDIRGDLPELVCAACPAPTGVRPVYFRSLGLGLEDIAMAYGIWKLATGETA